MLRALSLRTGFGPGSMRGLTLEGMKLLSRVETRLLDCPFPPTGWRPSAFESDLRLQRLESFVQTNFREPISLGRAAEQACLARCYFSTYFRRRAGVGFHRWLTCLRIQQATKVLAESEGSVTEVAFQVGFQDMTTFSRSFRRITGTTPSRYRRRQRRAKIGAESQART